MGQYTPIIIMSVVTLVVTLMFLVPTRMKFGGALVRFYWCGFWMFLSLIALVAGGAEVLKLAGQPVEKLSVSALSGIMAAFIVFVIFAWVRLVGVALIKGLRKMKKTA